MPEIGFGKIFQRVLLPIIMASCLVAANSAIFYYSMSQMDFSSTEAMEASSKSFEGSPLAVASTILWLGELAVAIWAGYRAAKPGMAILTGAIGGAVLSLYTGILRAVLSGLVFWFFVSRLPELAVFDVLAAEMPFVAELIGIAMVIGTVLGIGLNMLAGLVLGAVGGIIAGRIKK